MTPASRRPSTYGTEAAVAKAKRRRRLTWVLAAIWASDWIFVWTDDVGLGELGAWLRLLVFGFLVYRSVVGTKLPEWFLTWAWMFVVLAMWLVEIAWLGDFALDAKLVSSNSPVRVLGELDDIADVLSATLAVTMLGWILGLFELVVAAVSSSVAFRIRREQIAINPELETRPILLPRQRSAHRTTVALQTPLFVLFVAASVIPLSAGITLLLGADTLPPNEQRGAMDIARTLLLAGSVAFVLAVVELRQLQRLRWCQRPRLLLAALLPIPVLGALIVAAITGPLLWWALVGIALLWCMAQLSAIRTLWPVRGREAARGG